MDHLVQRGDQRARSLVVQVPQRHAEEQREHQDLQDSVVGHRLHDALRKHLGDEIAQVQRSGLELRGGARLWQRNRHGTAGLGEVGNQQAQRQRDQRSAHEPSQRPRADTPHGARIAHGRHACSQGRKHQGRDDHFDHAQKNIRQQAKVTRDFLGGFGCRRPGVAGIADQYPQNHGQDDHGGQAIEFHAMCDG